MSNFQKQILLCFSLLFLALFGKIQAKSLSFEDTVRHKIKKGETITAIISKYDVTGTDILKWNKKIKKLDDIKANDILLIVRDSKKGYNTPRMTDPAPKTSLTNKTSATDAPLLAIKYRVKYGELLSNIARKFNTTSEAIQEASGLESINSIKVGTELTIYPKNNAGEPIYDFGKKVENTSQNATMTTTQNTDNPSSEPKNNTKKTDLQPEVQMIDYVVQEGDVLGKLAQRYGTTVQKIQQENLIMHPKDLQIGMKIRIPATKTPDSDAPKSSNSSSKIEPSDAEKLALGEPVAYTVRLNDTIDSIAKKFGVSADDIRKDNEITDDQVVKMGMKLLIFKRN